MFNEGRPKVHEERRSGRPSLITEDLKTRIEQHIRTNRRFTLHEIHEKFPQISHSLIHEIVIEHLHYKNIYGRWMPLMLSKEHKGKYMGALTFLVNYQQQGDHFLDQAITGDETWDSHLIPESNCQSLEWHQSRSPSKPIKFKHMLSTRKVLATVFWDKKGNLLAKFMPNQSMLLHTVQL